MSAPGVPQQSATRLSYLPGLYSTGAHLPYLEHLLACTPRCPACASGRQRSQTCVTCGKPVRDGGLSADARDSITESVLDLFPDAGTPRPATVASPPHQCTSSAGEPLLMLGLGVLGGLVSSMFGLGGYVEMSAGKPSGVLYAVGALVTPLMALWVFVDTLRTRRSCRLAAVKASRAGTS